MTSAFTTILRAERGGTVVEFALVAPVLTMLLVGMLQIGILAEANAGLQHAVGEGARYATLYPSPSDDAIKARVRDRKFGLKTDNIIGPSVSRGLSDGTKYVQVSMSYKVPLEFVLFDGPDVQLTETRRAFTP